MAKATTPAARKTPPRYAGIKLDPDTGRPAWASMSPETLAKLKEIFSSEDAKKALGLETPARAGAGDPAAESPTVQPLAVKSFYEWLAVGQGYCAGFAMKIPADIATAYFAMTPEELTQLDGPTRALLDKYGADFLARYSAEINIGFILSRHIAVSVGRLRADLPKIRAALEKQKSIAKETKQAADGAYVPAAEGENGSPKASAPMQSPGIAS